MHRLVVLALLVSLTSCFDGKKTQALYPIDSLLSAQARYLSQKKVIHKKIVVLGDKEEEISIGPQDSAAWRNELEVFSALSVINKPVNKSFYTIEELSDVRSNLKMKSFSTKKEDLPVKYFRIYFQHQPNRIRKLEARFNDLSSLYKSSRELRMEFQQFGDTVVLTSYDIVGGQKMVMDDSVQYSVRGSLTVLN